MENTETIVTEAAESRPRISIGKIIKAGIGLIVLASAIAAGVHYWHQSQIYVTTDNAYLNAHTVGIAAQVSGPITAIHVQDQQIVKAGDPLFEIDSRPYQLALAEAEAQLELSYQSTSQESAAVEAARALVAQRAAELRNAQSNERRVQDLVVRNLVSQQNAEAVHTQAETADAAVKAAEANLAQAMSALGKAGDNNASVRVALRHLLMQDAASCRHPLDVAGAKAPAIAEAVAVFHGSCKDVGNRFNPAVGMPRKPRPILVGVVVAEIVEEEKRIVVGRVAEPERTAQPDPGALESGFGLGNVLDGSDRHGRLLLRGDFFEYTPEILGLLDKLAFRLNVVHDIERCSARLKESLKNE